INVFGATLRKALKITARSLMAVAAALAKQAGLVGTAKKQGSRLFAPTSSVMSSTRWVCRKAIACASWLPAGYEQGDCTPEIIELVVSPEHPSLVSRSDGTRRRANAYRSSA